jgi:alkylhydroperoxidase family enzyme
VAESDRAEALGGAVADFAALGMPNAAAVYANHPALGQAVAPHVRYIVSGSTLAPRERALLGLRTAWLARSPYLWAHLAPVAREAGLSADELRRVAQGPGAGWEGFEATLLYAADELYVDAMLSDPTWAALDERFDVAQLIDTIDTVGALTMHAGALNTLGVAVEPAVAAERLPDVPRTFAAERTNFRLEGKGPRIPPAAGGRPAANVFSTFNHNPAADRVRGAINTHVNRNSLEPRHREILLVRIGVLCRSEYEYAAHVRSGLRVGMTPADVELVLAGPETGTGAPLDLALLGATDELHRDDAVSAETWAVLADALTPEQLLDVLFAVGGYRSTSMLINSAGVQLDADMADYRFPPELR